MDQKRVSKKGRKLEKSPNFWSWIGIAIVIVIFFFLLLWKLNQTIFELPLSAAEFGDSFGMANAFFSSLAFAFLIVTALMQRMELKYQRKELKLTRKELKKSNNVEVVIKLFNEFREPKWNKVRDKIKSKGADIKLKDVKNYIHMLNHFGFLLEHKYVDVRSLYETFGRSAMHTWEILKPQIYSIRKNSNSPAAFYPYQYHFQYLCYRLYKYSPKGKKHIDELIREMEHWESKNKFN